MSLKNFALAAVMTTSLVMISSCSESPQMLVLQGAAERGDAKSQDDLGLSYAEGKDGFAKSPKDAFYWFKKSAEQGNVEAQQNLARAYYRGFGAPRSYEQAAYWYQKAAEQGNVVAQTNLGVLLLEGEKTTKPDYPKAIYWLQKAVAQQDPLAEFNLSKAYFKGLGVAKDYGKSLALARQSADRGLFEAQEALAEIYFDSHVTTPDMSESFFWLSLATRQEPRLQPSLKKLEAKLTPQQRDAVIARLAAWKPTSKERTS